MSDDYPELRDFKISTKPEFAVFKSAFDLKIPAGYEIVGFYSRYDFKISLDEKKKWPRVSRMS